MAVSYIEVRADRHDRRAVPVEAEEREVLQMRCAEPGTTRGVSMSPMRRTHLPPCAGHRPDGERSTRRPRRSPVGDGANLVAITPSQRLRRTRAPRSDDPRRAIVPRDEAGGACEALGAREVVFVGSALVQIDLPSPRRRRWSPSNTLCFFALTRCISMRPGVGGVERVVMERVEVEVGAELRVHALQHVGG